ITRSRVPALDCPSAPRPTHLPYTTLFRSPRRGIEVMGAVEGSEVEDPVDVGQLVNAGRIGEIHAVIIRAGLPSLAHLRPRLLMQFHIDGVHAFPAGRERSGEVLADEPGRSRDEVGSHVTPPFGGPGRRPRPGDRGGPGREDRSGSTGQ